MAGKKMTTWHNLSNPDDFTDWNNIDGSDIPEQHKIDYTGDLYYKGAAKTFWTPRRRMLNSIAYKEQQVNEKKQKRQKQRQAKMDTWGKTRREAASFADFTARRERSESSARAVQEDNDGKSTLLFLAVFGGAILLCGAAIVGLYYLSGL